MGYSPWGCRRVGHNLATEQQHGLMTFKFLSVGASWVMVRWQLLYFSLYFCVCLAFSVKKFNDYF